MAVDGGQREEMLRRTIEGTVCCRCRIAQDDLGVALACVTCTSREKVHCRPSLRDTCGRAVDACNRGGSRAGCPVCVAQVECRSLSTAIARCLQKRVGARTVVRMYECGPVRQCNCLSLFRGHGPSVLRSIPRLGVESRRVTDDGSAGHRRKADAGFCYLLARGTKRL
ncbi:uncharacterized protein B0H18DRAFT_1038364 [Fomitopsis serialis]|uniref:uncharacterized protein n=1 Tax=Fomitopsis serialis TaxID=139415 RepID=UPI002007263C|nr:uncharacterized protein B0H18DRAFT_1038364 [Neoantrodia serialis]KAH9916485.1 hypothetical protein B0H18DRAFT_1038364 [Neoantrodia serialis]